MDKKNLKRSKKHVPSFKMPFTPKSHLKGNLKYERKFYLDVSTWKEMEDRIHPKGEFWFPISFMIEKQSCFIHLQVLERHDFH